MKVTEKLIESSRRMHFTINENKTKYLLMAKGMVNKVALNLGFYAFKQGYEFKYLGINMNNKKKTRVMKSS